MKKILIVEDEAILLKDLADKLTKEGFEVISARNGEEGLSLALGNHPDLILLDIVMPIMDGMTMLYKLRQDDWGKDAGVILLTNLSDTEKVAQAYTEGVNDFLVKSDWSIGDIVSKIRGKFSNNPN